MDKDMKQVPFKVLDKNEKEVYDSFVNLIPFKKLDNKVWKQKAPDGFEGW